MPEGSDSFHALRRHGNYLRHYSVEVGKQVDGGAAKTVYARVPQPFIAPEISLRTIAARVRFAVYLDREPSRRTAEA